MFTDRSNIARLNWDTLLQSFERELEQMASHILSHQVEFRCSILKHVPPSLISQLFVCCCFCLIVLYRAARYIMDDIDNSSKTPVNFSETQDLLAKVQAGIDRMAAEKGKFSFDAEFYDTIESLIFHFKENFAREVSSC